MSLEQYTMRDYIHAFRRRSRTFVSVFLAIFGVAAFFAVVLPAQYRSGAEMAINLEGPNIELVEPLALTVYADQYVQTLEQKILTGTNLRAWLNASNAYANDRDGVAEGELVSRMREDIRINMVFTSVIDERTGKEVDLVTGFTASFYSEDPQAAHVVADKMAQAFLDEDKATRVRRAETASSFLQEQIEQQQAEIIRLEEKIAQFKQDNAGTLPEFMVMNMTVLERTERDLENLRTQISSLEQDRVFRQAQLDDLSINSTVAPVLAKLEDEYRRVVAIYGPDHPDVIRINRQVAAITGQGVPTGGSTEIAVLELQLADARQKYTEAHPDVVSLKRQISALQAREGVDANNEPQDTGYLQLKAQLNAIDTNLQALYARRAELSQKQEDLQVRIANTPQVERQYLVLVRDRQTAQLAFDDLRKRLTQAQQTESFESGERGARLELVRSASVPSEPASPHRIAIVLLGAFLGFVVAAGTALIVEMSDSTVRGSKDIQVVLSMYPIVAVPVVQNSLSRGSRRKQLSVMTTSFIVLAVIVFIIYSTLLS